LAPREVEVIRLVDQAHTNSQSAKNGQRARLNILAELDPVP
jgi:hypothetical protein